MLTASYVDARSFVNAGPPNGWCGDPLFIDGLDQMRADSVWQNTPLDNIIQRLSALDRPRFRICCREADWLQADQAALRAAAPREVVDVLHLDPLTDQQVLELLSRRSDRVPDALAFFERAEQESLDAMLRNPLLLSLLVDAVSGTEWPASREEIYVRACLRMAAEHDEVVDAASRRRRAQPEPEAILDMAGWIAAVLLLSGNDVVVTGRPLAVPCAGEVSIASLRGNRDQRCLDAALASKLFIADSHRRIVRHRSIAEYLAARAIGGLIRDRQWRAVL